MPEITIGTKVQLKPGRQHEVSAIDVMPVNQQKAA